MKIENISISNIDIDNGTATLTFDIAEITNSANIDLKIDDGEFTQILENQEQGTITYDLTNMPRGIHDLALKISNEEEEYISEPFLVKFKVNPTIEGLECTYSDSTGKFILKFTILGDELFTYNVNFKLDENEYQEIMTSQIMGEKTFESISEMGSHTCVLKISDGYDEYETDVFTFDITNQKPILSKVLAKDISNDGSANIYYGVKDIENSTLTHYLNIDGTNEAINPTRLNSFYTYKISGLSVGNHTCFISVTDGIDTVTTDEVNIEIFANSTDKKEILRQSKARYDFAYQSLKDIITSVVSDSVFDYDVENEIIQKAQESYNETYSEFNRIAQQSIDIIGTNKVNLTKEDLTSQINDVDNALNSLETTMEGVFRDGLLSDSEKILLSDNLNIIAKEKVDVDRDYETLYNNEDLLDPAKSKLQTNYNAFVVAQNSLATLIDNIIKKDSIIDNEDKANIDSAFEAWRNALGNYRNASLEAIDSIAKKKADDSSDIVNERWAEIILDPESGIQSQVGQLYDKVSGTGGIEQRLTTAEQTITTEGITNLIKDTYYSKEEIDETIEDIRDDIHVAVASVDVQYYLSTSQTSLVGGSWSSVAPTWVNGKYMWSKTVTTLTDGTVSESAPTCIAGAKGDSASPNYTWIRYADDANGNGISNSPDGKDYIGFAYNKTTSTESNTPSDYTWSLIRGEKGTDGKDGIDGKDGTSIEILGTYGSVEELNQAHPNNNNKGDSYIIGQDLYIWDGEEFQNIGQIRGEDGITFYTWVKYSDHADGTNLYDVPNDNTMYIGIATNQTSITESTDKTKYTWSKFRGDDGVDGTNGIDGITYYTWIKYANDANGNGISNSPDGKDYIGFAYNKTTSTESNTPSDYVWSLIKGKDGTDGTNGINGTNGKDGTTYYTWIKYSDSSDGSNMYDTPNDNTMYIGIATNQTNRTESTNKSDYIWSKFRGDDGVDGTDGKDGTEIVSVTEEYYLSTSKTTQTGGSWVTTPPAWQKGKYLWTRTKIVYANPSSTEYTTPVCDASWEVSNDVQEQIDNNKTEIETMKETVSIHTTNLNDITSRVSTTESQITTINGSVSNLTNRISTAEQKITDDAIISTVSSTIDSKVNAGVNGIQGQVDEIKTDISTIEQTTQSIQSTVASHTGSISTLTQRADSFDVTIAGKADSSNIISKINASTEGITISSSKVNITGFVTFSDLSTSGFTTINGGNITSGTIRGIKIVSTATDTTRAEMEGDGLRFYSPSKQAGKISFDSNGEGTESSAKDRFLIQSLNNYVLKLLSTGDMSITSYDVIYFEANRLQTNCNLDLTGKQLNCGNIYCSDNITCTTVTTTSGITASGSLQGASLKVTGSVTGGTASLGAINGSSLSITGGSWLGAVNCGKLEPSSIACSGTINTSGSLQGYTCSVANNMSVENNAWIKYLYVNGTQVTSDETLKTDIKYVNIDEQTISEDSGLMSPNVNITTSDMHEFIETLPMVSYRLIDDVEKGKDETYYGFLAQEILYSKVGSELVTVPTTEEQELVGDKLRYSEIKYISFIAGALQEEIKRRKALEEKLDNFINNSNNK